jgi:demethylphylloquinone reductase
MTKPLADGTGQADDPSRPRDGGGESRGTTNTPASAIAGPIVIIGGGFGGLYTALALAEQRNHPPLLLIEPRDCFLFLPLLYEALSGELRRWEIAPRYDSLLAGRGIAWLRDSVARIDSSRQTVEMRSGRTISYGQLVVATGARNHSFGIPGVVEHALPFRNLDDVDRLQQLIAQLRQRRHPLQRLAIIGAGPSGVELACKVADLLEGAAIVELIEQGPGHLPHARAFNREQAALALQRRDIRLRCHCRVLSVGSDHLQIRCDGPSAAVDERLMVDGVVWTAGLSFSPPSIQPAPSQTAQGRLEVDPDLQLRGLQGVYAVGDIAALPATDALGTTAQVAFQQATCLANNLLQARRGVPGQAFAYNDLGEMLSLGRGEASLVAGGITLAGMPAFQLRRLAYLTRLPRRSHQLRVAAGWIADWR